jgi:hypothetical protein
LNYFTGAHVSFHGSKGSLPGQFSGIGSISFDREREHLYVADGDNHRVQVLRYEDFSCARIIGSYGTGPGQFIRPYGTRAANILPQSRLVPSHLVFLWSQALHSTAASTW